MVRVLVTGANGYIGRETAIELARRGHKVYGLVRKQEQGAFLASNEVTPVYGSIADGKLSDDVLAQVSVVIDTVNDPTDKPLFASNRKLIAQLVEVGKKTGVKRRYIYTSGCLVYGDYKGAVVDETWPVQGNLAVRGALEQEIVNNRDIEGVVLRPAWVYGGKGNAYIKDWYFGNKNGDIEIFGRPDKRQPWIHVVDLADAYVRVTEAPRALVAGEIFDVADDTRDSYETVKVAYARSNGVKGKVVHLPAGTDWWSATVEAGNAVCDSKKLRSLGWKPAHATVLDSVDVATAAAKAPGGVLA